jgi:phage protein D/phage baseplate assembly protein gpV
VSANPRYYAPRFNVRVAGLTLAADVTSQALSVSYDNNVDLADMFTIVLQNPDNRFTDSPLFDLGKSVEIHMGYGDDLRPMMLGEITALQPAYPQGAAPTLTVSGYDKSYKLRHNQPDRPPFQYMNDSLIAAQIALEAGLIPIVDPSPHFHEHIQQTGSDMAFLKERARANFFQVYVHWDRLYFRFPRPQTQAYVLEWGKSLSSFTPRLSKAGLAGLQIIRGYNEDLAQTIVGFATSLDLSVDNIVERLGSTALDMLTSLGRRVLRKQAVKSPLDAVLLAKALLQEILEGMYEGTGTCIGIPELTADAFVAIRGVGKRFSGQYRLKKVTHTIDDRGYTTSFEVTQRSGSSFLQLLRKDLTEEPPPNKAESFQGVVVGKVTQNLDPKGLGRVKLSFPWFSDNHESDWARCAAPMAGSGRGVYFLPDRGDEVLVGFLHGDFTTPVVLGGLWNGPNRPPVSPADPLNRFRVLKTEAGHTVTFDDTKGAGKITIETKGGARVVLKADGSVDVEAKTNLNLKATGDINLDAANVKVKVKGTMDVS